MDKIIIMGKLPGKRADKGRIHSLLGLCETVTTQAGKGHAPIILKLHMKRNCYGVSRSRDRKGKIVHQELKPYTMCIHTYVGGAMRRWLYWQRRL